MPGRAAGPGRRTGPDRVWRAGRAGPGVRGRACGAGPGGPGRAGWAGRAGPGVRGLRGVGLLVGVRGSERGTGVTAVGGDCGCDRSYVPSMISV
jgi:hypothetical protein